MSKVSPSRKMCVCILQVQKRMPDMPDIMHFMTMR